MERLKNLHKKLKEIEPNREIPIYLTETGWMGNPAFARGRKKKKQETGWLELCL
jgi:hypothetical protein